MKNQAGQFFDIVDFCNINEMHRNYAHAQSNMIFNADYIHAMMW